MASSDGLPSLANPRVRRVLQRVGRAAAGPHVTAEQQDRLEKRQRQIDYGKGTLGYERYVQLVPPHRRLPRDPVTPDAHAGIRDDADAPRDERGSQSHGHGRPRGGANLAQSQGPSKRRWDSLVRAWRRGLHGFDLEYDPMAERAERLATMRRGATTLDVRDHACVREGEDAEEALPVETLPDGTVVAHDAPASAQPFLDWLWSRLHARGHRTATHSGALLLTHTRLAALEEDWQEDVGGGRREEAGGVGRAPGGPLAGKRMRGAEETPSPGS